MGENRWTRRDLLRTGVAGASFLALASLGLTGCNGAEANNLAFEVEPIPYGDDPMQVGELSRPLVDGPIPVVVLIHGGYWRVGFTREAMSDLASALARLGYAAWNLDYRRFGELGGGWPGTAVDVATGIDKLAELGPSRRLDVSKVVVVGHSAGGQLAMWAAARGSAPAGSPGAAPSVLPRAVVSLAGVLDLMASARSTQPGGGVELRRAIEDYLAATPDQSPSRYAEASPIARLPIGVPQLVVHGTADDRVPVQQSRDYVTAAVAAGDRAELLELDGFDHFQLLDPTTTCWDQVRTWIGHAIGDPLARPGSTTSTSSLPAG